MCKEPCSTLYLLHLELLLLFGRSAALSSIADTSPVTSVMIALPFRITRFENFLDTEANLE